MSRRPEPESGWHHRVGEDRPDDVLRARDEFEAGGAIALLERSEHAELDSTLFDGDRKERLGAP
jgi:hypothetical protein